MERAARLTESGVARQPTVVVLDVAPLSVAAAQAAFNAASCHARLGQKSEATTFIELAAEHPLMKEKAAALKASIDKLP